MEGLRGASVFTRLAAGVPVEGTACHFGGINGWVVERLIVDGERPGWDSGCNDVCREV